uniref:Isopropylmalate dehydrogenase-like domain-containing protein n=2 Tax=Eutreptiella gymnastica TaxID=73025 RepID=A0A7S1I8P5_9EUGL|mmetsp:Transcript_139231/g.242117  ORF Transcript_139231/g.242117 Transcript_139231/m.242117 type:complete len:135 (+) Transcript_139231:120-524(+)
MLRNPGRYDVILTPNMYGDFIAESAAAIVGGVQYQAQCNVGDGFCLVHPIHGTADDIACHIANPAGIIRATGLMLAHLLDEEGIKIAQQIDDALFGILQDKVVVPADMGGSSTTEEVADAFLDSFEALWRRAAD